METLARAANRGSVSTGYDIENSYKNENDNAEKMTHTYDSAPTSQQKGTISLWYKRTEINTNIGIFQFGDDASGDYLAVRWATEANGSRETYRSRIGGTSVNIGDANGAVRDTSAWYHMVIAIDTTQATATNRFRVYRNGEELTFSTDNRSSITQNANMAIGENGKDILIGEGVYRFNGYIAEVNYIDGQQLSSTDFGEYDSDSGIWIPKKYTGTYGNNGFYLDFKNASNLGEDQSGNNHDFTLNNITSADQATDTPTNNFCTYNSTMYMFGNTFVAEGATKTSKLYQNWITPMPTIGVSRGKWYAEFEFVNTGIDSMIGVVPMGEPGFEGSGVTNSNSYLGQSTNSIGYYGQQGNLYNNASGSSYGSSYVAGDKMAVALDMDNGKVYFAKNGTWQNSGVPTSGATGTGAIDLIQPTETHGISSSIWGNNSACLSNYGGYTTISISTPETDDNGYGTFEYAPPSGYYALCTKNLAEFG